LPQAKLRIQVKQDRNSRTSFSIIEGESMGLVFDAETASRYNRWYMSPEGRYVEQRENWLILDLLHPRKGQRLLDVGCGTGNHLLLFKRMGLDVTGIEPSVPMLSIARGILGKNAALHQGFAEDLPYDDNEFDLVCLITTMEFCTDPIRALSEAMRVARQRIFIGVLNSVSFIGIQRKIEGLFRHTLYREARFFSIWEVLYLIQALIGKTQIEWGSVINFPFRSLDRLRHLDEATPLRKNPFGAFIGIGVDMNYRYLTVENPLITKLARNRRAQISEGTTCEPITLPPAKGNTPALSERLNEQ
jgi:ubiquinone/menaquinone biosynthesis C-methylase UbiE